MEAEAELGRQQPGSYYVHLQDSQVSLACMTKGRSASWQINKELRRSICNHVGYNVKGSYGYVRSKLNPGDDPTRGQMVRRASRQPASWWKALEEEEYQEFDRFLEEQGCLPEQIAELPPEDELFEEFKIEKKTCREMRTERGRGRRKDPRREAGTRGARDADLPEAAGAEETIARR